MMAGISGGGLPSIEQLPLERKRPLARCSLCGRPLRAKPSIRRGMGPTCARRGEQGRLPL
jgi:hypothetical protein